MDFMVVRCVRQENSELILEGPRENAEKARDVVKACMERSLGDHIELAVDLVVDSKIANTWYEAKEALN